MELPLCVGITEWGIVPLGNRFFFQGGNIKDTQKLRFSVRLPTVHPGAMRYLLSDVCVGMPNKQVLLTLT